MTVQCINGEWKLQRQDLLSIPDCERNNSSLIFFILNLKIIFLNAQQPAIHPVSMVAAVYHTTCVSVFKLSVAHNANMERNAAQQQN